MDFNQFFHFGLKVWKRVCILQTRTEIGHGVSRRGLKPGVGKLHMNRQHTPTKRFEEYPVPPSFPGLVFTACMVMARVPQGWFTRFETYQVKEESKVISLNGNLKIPQVFCYWGMARFDVNREHDWRNKLFSKCDLALIRMWFSDQWDNWNSQQSVSILELTCILKCRGVLVG